MKITGHKKLLLVALLLLLASLFAATGSVADDSFRTPKAKVTAFDAATNAQFGFSVAVNSGIMVVGARYADKAYVFSRTDSEWKEVTDLTPDETPPLVPSGDFGFGYSVSISDTGNTVVVAAPSRMVAYVFEKVGETWSRSKLQTSEPGFILCVAMHGDTILVGNTSQAAVYVFNKQDDHWVQEETKLKGDPGSGAGVSISIGSSMLGDDKVVAVGASTGLVYVYTCSDLANGGCEGEYEDRLSGGSKFGSSVAISGDNLAVGSPAESKVHLYTKEADKWSPNDPPLPDGEPDSMFGTSVAISGDTLVVGAPESEYLGVKTGLAYVYRFDQEASRWNKEAILAAEEDDIKPDGKLGGAVAIDGTTVVVGAAFYDALTAQKAGAAYVYTVSQPLVANAGDDQVAVEGDFVELDGSSVPDDDDITFEWKQIIGPEVDHLSGEDTATLTFIAPSVEDECMTLTFQLTVTDLDGASDSDEVLIRVFPNNEIHAKLGGKHRHWWYWHKYTFDGSYGDKITIRLEADQDGWHRGEKATLILKDKTRGVRLLMTKKGSLPLDINTTLEADGKYAVYVFKHPWFWSWWRHKSFEGDYVLTLEGTCGRLGTSYRCKKK